MKYYFNKTVNGTFEDVIDKVTQRLRVWNINGN